MRELIYYVATTLDGFIAHQDGSFEGFPWDEAYLADIFEQFPSTKPAAMRTGDEGENRWFDAVLMGRKTYDVAFKEGITNPYVTLDQYVISQSLTESPDEAVTLVRDDVASFVQDLKQQEGKGIWLCGGGNLAGQLFRAGLIDQLIVKVNPVLFGRGIPLFTGPIAQTALTLTDSKVYESGHALLFYRVEA